MPKPAHQQSRAEAASELLSAYLQLAGRLLVERLKAEATDAVFEPKRRADARALLAKTAEGQRFLAQLNGPGAVGQFAATTRATKVEIDRGGCRGTPERKRANPNRLSVRSRAASRKPGPRPLANTPGYPLQAQLKDPPQ